MYKGIAATTVSAALVFSQVSIAATCQKASDAKALQTAALQQEMMVAALVCKDIGAYNDFVLSHRADLQVSDKALLAFFVTSNPLRGDDDYNLYKTELANAASLRSMHDSQFCTQVEANFRAAEGQPLEHVLAVLPYPVGTGTVSCQLPDTPLDLAKND